MSETLITQKTFYLSPENTHYVQTVLRMHLQDILEIFNNTNYVFLSKIIYMKKNYVLVYIFEKKLKNFESPVHIHLGQVIQNNKKMDFSIQKSTEMGVNVITPLFSKYSNFSIKHTNILKKIQHWNKIAISACQQCRRNVIPEICYPENIASWCQKHTKTDLKIVFFQNAQVTVDQLKKNVKFIKIIIGAEGGFSQSEIKEILKKGFISTKLGPRILRTETAVIAAMSALQIIFGDLS